MTAKLLIYGSTNIDSGAAGDIINNNGQVSRIRKGVEMSDQPCIGTFIIIRGNGEQAVRTGRLGRTFAQEIT